MTFNVPPSNVRGGRFMSVWMILIFSIIALAVVVPVMGIKSWWIFIPITLYSTAVIAHFGCWLRLWAEEREGLGVMPISCWLTRLFLLEGLFYIGVILWMIFS
ncbi:hypothetical protein ACFL13_00055 [Patescibacteria group bacterium]